MPQNIIQKSINLLLKRQTNILSAAFIIMLTVILSQILGLVRQRLLVSIFGASNILGIYNYATLLPDTIFQLTIAAALSSAFIPVFSDYLHKGKKEEANSITSTLLVLGLVVFFILSILLSIFAPFLLQLFNGRGQFSPHEMDLMANMMRIVVFGQLLFIIGTFLTAILQSYNHFFIPGIAAALYNLGIIIGVFFLSSFLGIYSAPVGIIIGSCLFILVQLPMIYRVGFQFKPAWKFVQSDGVKRIFNLMWPRTVSIIVFQVGTLAIASLISFLIDPGRMLVIYDFAKTLAFAPVVLFGQSIAQAAFPVLAREKDDLQLFKQTFLTSFNQMLYLILPISALILVLRIPIVRLIFGADMFDWDATVLTGRTLAFFSLSIFASALIMLIYRAFYALQNTFLPFVVGLITTILMILMSGLFVLIYSSGLQKLVYPYSLFNGAIDGELVVSFGVEGLAFAYSITTILSLVFLMVLLRQRIGAFKDADFFTPLFKIFFSSMLTAIALYIPLKFLDQLVFDTSRTVGLLVLTGISSAIGLSLYLFLTWLLDVKEARTYLFMLKKIGNWREVLGITEEVIDANRVNP